METLEVYHKNRLSVLEVEYKIKSLINNIAQVPASHQANGWKSWIKPVVISLLTLTVKYVISLAFHLLPKAFYKVALIGPIIKVIVEGPESLLTDALTPEEIKEKFNQIVQTGDTAYNHVTTETQRLDTVLTRVVEEIGDINNRLGNLPIPASSPTVDCQEAINSVAASISNQEITYDPVQISEIVVNTQSDIFND